MNSKDLYRKLPKVDDVLASSLIQEKCASVPRSLILKSITEILDARREKIAHLGEVCEEKTGEELVALDKIIRDIITRASLHHADKLRRVINAAGVVIHTNMGRSVLDERIVARSIKTMSSYSNLELNLDTGKRGSRYDHLNSLITQLTGAEASHVVNNNAAAVILVLSELARGKEVIVSRGELVEIGGAFRIPDIMKLSGCSLVEVGTTNRTRIKDYENAINENTAMILKVHTSNYKIMGFTEETSLEEMAELAKRRGVILYNDIGSGSLIDLGRYGVDREPTVMDALKAGADVVSFSCDKLLGGPQAGIILASKENIARMKRNQLTRALRIDKVIISLLEQSLKVYLDEESVEEYIPTIRMLSYTQEELRNKAEDLRKALVNIGGDLEVQIEEGYSEVGGGSLPMTRLDTYLVSVTSKEHSETEMQTHLRENSIPIICRTVEKKLILDPRCLLGDDVSLIAGRMSELLK